MSHHFTIENEAGVEAIEKHLHHHAYLSGKGNPNEVDAKILSELKDAPDRHKHPHFFAWFWGLALFSEAARATWTHGAQHHDGAKKDGKKECAKTDGAKTECAKTEAKKECAKTEAPKKEEDELDLFGDDTEEDKKNLEEMKKAKEEADKKKKEEADKKKKLVVAKSSVVFDVKAYEETFDFVKLGKEIKEKIQMDGLVWQQTFKILPVAYQIKKLQCGMIIEDDKVSVDDILEKIQELWPDDIQSCDIVEFNKV